MTLRKLLDGLYFSTNDVQNQIKTLTTRSSRSRAAGGYSSQDALFPCLCLDLRLLRRNSIACQMLQGCATGIHSRSPNYALGRQRRPVLRVACILEHSDLIQAWAYQSQSHRVFCSVSSGLPFERQATLTSLFC